MKEDALCVGDVFSFSSSPFLEWGGVFFRRKEEKSDSTRLNPTQLDSATQVEKITNY